MALAALGDGSWKPPTSGQGHPGTGSELGIDANLSNGPWADSLAFVGPGGEQGPRQSISDGRSLALEDCHLCK